MTQLITKSEGRPLIVYGRIGVDTPVETQGGRERLCNKYGIGHDRVRRNRDMANLPTGGNGCWIIKVKYYGAHLFIRNNLV